jgi:carbon storage regulator CsrA
MLVLQRKYNEKINVIHNGETITITVVEIAKNSVRLGFAGPRTFDVEREEVTNALKEEAAGDPAALAGKRKKLVSRRQSQRTARD